MKRAEIPYDAIPAAGVHGVGARALPGNFAQLARGLAASRQILRRFQPEVLFFTGGYVAVPMALAGRSLPQLVYVPDIEPGLALKTLARFASRIAVTTGDSRSYFNNPSKVEVTGYPTRQELKTWDRSSAQLALGLSPEWPVLLVFGGSKGARSINRAVLGVLSQLLEEMQVVHISGQLDWAEVGAARSALPAALQARYRAFPYLHAEMGAALSAADLALSRAGASSLGEYPLFGLPAVLVPYPYAWRYQKVNADYMTSRGAALTIADAELPVKVLPLVRELMRDEPRRAAMRRAMHSLARPQAAQEIAGLLIQLSRSAQPKRI